MDAAVAFEGLNSALGELLAARDFEGAESLLGQALAQTPAIPRAFVHLRFARLYREWNKLTSAVDHLHRALESEPVDACLRAEILEDLKVVKHRQATQRP